METVKKRGFHLVELATRKFNSYRGLQRDPSDNTAENYYAEVYKSFLSRYDDGLYAEEGTKRILDVGCGTGRFAIELAARGHDVLAFDYSPDAVKMARRKAARRGVTLDVQRGDAHEVLNRLPEDRFDVILCLEVLYVSPHYEELLTEMRRLLKPQGILACSHRPKHYFVITLLAKRDYSAALRVARSSEGMVALNNVPIYYNWQTKKDIVQLYERVGLELMGLHPIGMFSGFGVDGMADIANPNEMTDADQATLLTLETEDLDDYVATGRYTLAVASKSG